MGRFEEIITKAREQAPKHKKAMEEHADNARYALEHDNFSIAKKDLEEAIKHRTKYRMNNSILNAAEEIDKKSGDGGE